MAITSIGALPVRKVSESTLKFNFLVYGLSGVGKTRLAGTAFDVPELCPILLLNIEGGDLTLRSLYPDIEAVRITSWDQLKKVYENLKQGKHGYKTVILDSLTEMQKMGMDHTMLQRHGDDDQAVPEIKEWNINVEQVRKYVRLFRDLEGVNVILTALERVDIDKRTQLSRKKPSLSGKVADEVSGFLDIVAYLYVQDIEKVNTRILLTGNIPGTVAKDRSGQLPLQIANPTMKIIFDYINGDGKVEANLERATMPATEVKKTEEIKPKDWEKTK